MIRTQIADEYEKDTDEDVLVDDHLQLPHSHLRRLRCAARFPRLHVDEPTKKQTSTGQLEANENVDDGRGIDVNVHVDAVGRALDTQALSRQKSSWT